MKEKSHYFLSSIGVILVFLCGVGCTSNKTQDSYDGTLDAQTLGTEIAPCIMKVDAIQSAKELGCKVVAVNVDHSIREASADDSAFVKNFCKKNGIEIYSFKVNAVKYSEDKKVVHIIDF